MYFKGQCDIGHKLDLWIWCLRVIACSCKPVYAFHATILLQHFVVNMVPTFIQHFYCTTQICIAHTCCHNVSVCPLHAGIVSKRLKISLRAGVLPAVTHRRTSYNQIQYNETEPMLLKHWKHFRKKCVTNTFLLHIQFLLYLQENMRYDPGRRLNAQSGMSVRFTPNQLAEMHGSPQYSPNPQQQQQQPSNSSQPPPQVWYSVFL